MLLLEGHKSQRTQPRETPEWRSRVHKIFALSPVVTHNEFDPGPMPVEPITLAEIKTKLREIKETRRGIAKITIPALALATTVGSLAYGIANNNPHAYDPVRSDNEPTAPLIAPARPATHGSESAFAGPTHSITSEGLGAKRVAEDLVNKAFAAKAARGVVIDKSPATADNPVAQRHVYNGSGTLDIVLSGRAENGQQLDYSHTTMIKALELKDGTVTDSFDASAGEGPGPASWKARASEHAAEHIAAMLTALG